MYIEMTREKALEIMNKFKHSVSCFRDGNFFVFTHTTWHGSDCIVTNSKIHAEMLIKIDKLTH